MSVHLWNMAQLDDHHLIGMFVDKDNNYSWQMITTVEPIVDHTFNGDAGWSIEEIDPNHFEWNGRIVTLEWNGGNTAVDIE